MCQSDPQGLRHYRNISYQLFNYSSTRGSSHYFMQPSFIPVANIQKQKMVRDWSHEALCLLLTLWIELSPPTPCASIHASLKWGYSSLRISHGCCEGESGSSATWMESGVNPNPQSTPTASESQITPWHTATRGPDLALACFCTDHRQKQIVFVFFNG